MEGKPFKPLKLRVKDADDLTVLSSLLQDALLPVQDMTFLQKERRFVMVLNRFCWERAPEAITFDADEDEEDEESQEDVSFAEVGPGTVYERVNCGLTFDKVSVARFRNLDLEDRGRILELLAIEQKGERLLLRFADEAEIELVTTQIRGHLEDLGEPWPTTRRPDHPVEEED